MIEYLGVILLVAVLMFAAYKLKTLKHTYINMEDLRPKGKRLTQELNEVNDQIFELKYLEPTTRRDMRKPLDEV
jgi:hypothetical protein